MTVIVAPGVNETKFGGIVAAYELTAGDNPVTKVPEAAPLNVIFNPVELDGLVMFIANVGVDPPKLVPISLDNDKVPRVNVLTEAGINAYSILSRISVGDNPTRFAFDNKPPTVIFVGAVFVHSSSGISTTTPSIVSAYRVPQRKTSTLDSESVIIAELGRSTPC